MLKHNLRRLRRLLPSRLAGPSSLEPEQVLVQHGQFDADWYLSMYPDVAGHSRWASAPVEHYLQHGGFEGRKPNDWFDSAWYLQQYPDVQDAKINPYLHYLLFGQQEGRLANRHAVAKPVQPVIQRKVGYSDIRNRLALHLWGGLSEPALRALEEAYRSDELPDNERWSAAWHAARWYYFIGDIDKAYQLGNLLLELDPKQARRKEGVFLRAFCELHFGQYEQALQSLLPYEGKDPLDADLWLTRANCYPGDDKQRLDLINHAFTMHGYHPIQLKDEQQPLSISNIAAPAFADQVIGVEKVSIIMPVYQAEQYLEVAVGSLLEQTWKNLEIIIVDDCSPDATFALAQQLAAKDQRVVALQQSENSGAYAARNLGLQHASGDFITTHDADDWSHPQKIEMQIRYFRQHPAVMGLCTHWIRTRSDLTFTQNWRPNNALVHWSQSSFMFKRQVLDELGGWDVVRVGGDTEFIWRVKAKYGKAAYAQIHPEVPLAFALDDEGSLTRTKATHVRTVYYGLRHIYREICAWWHKNAAELHIEHPESRRSLTIPVGMQYRDGRSSVVDILLVSDFASPSLSGPVLSLVEQNQSIRFGLLHWPDFNVAPGKLTERYFQAIAHHGATPVAAGEQVLAKSVIVSSEELLRNPVDALPTLNSDVSIWVLSSQDAASSSGLKVPFGDTVEYCLPDAAQDIVSKMCS